MHAKKTLPKLIQEAIDKGATTVEEIHKSIVDLPLTHPIFRSQFEIKRVPQIPSINSWMGSGGGTSERGPDSAQPHVRAIAEALVNLGHQVRLREVQRLEAAVHEHALRVQHRAHGAVAHEHAAVDLHVAAGRHA